MKSLPRINWIKNDPELDLSEEDAKLAAEEAEKKLQKDIIDNMFDPNPLMKRVKLCGKWNTESF